MTFNQMLEKDYKNYDDCTWTALMPLSSSVSDAQLIQRSELGSYFGITSECEDPVTAFIALDYMLGKEFQTIANWGQEGVDWERGEDGKPQLLELPEGVEASHCGKGYPGSLLVQDVGPNYAVLSPWHVELDQELQTYAVHGFPKVYGTEEEINSLLTYESDMLTFAGEQMNLFITGQRSLDEFDDYIQTLKDMGIDDVIAVKQAQYDRYTANMK